MGNKNAINNKLYAVKDFVRLENKECYGEHLVKRGKKVVDNIDKQECDTIATLFERLLPLKFTAFDKNSWGATHIEATIKDMFEVYFDLNKFKLCFGEWFLEELGDHYLTDMIEAGFVATHMKNWKCKCLFEKRYGTEKDCHDTLETVAKILVDCMLREKPWEVPHPIKKRIFKRKKQAEKTA